MCRLNIPRLGALVAAGGLATGPALAAERTPAEVAAWVSANTDIAPGRIAIVTSDYVYGFEPLGPMTSTGEVLALVRTEAFAEAAGAARGVQSWEAHLLFDCRLSRVRLIRSADYRQRNRGGPPIAMEETAAWQTPSAGEPANQLLAAACDAAFAWPLRANSTQLATAMTPSAPPAPPVVVSHHTAPPLENPSAAASAGAYAIQVARGPSAAGARRALSDARKALGAAGAGLSATTEHTRLGARHRFTAVLSGFPTAAAAGMACATLRAADQGCLLRAAPADVGPADMGPADMGPAAPPQGFAVQLAYGPSREGAAKAVQRARKALGPLAAGLQDALESRADGRRHTALLSGFETPEAAARACEALHRAQLTCLVRAKRLGPPPLAAR